MRDEKNETQVLVLQEAKQVLAAENAKRIDAYKRAVQAALDEYRCVLDVSVVLRPGQVIPQVKIVPIVEGQ